MDELNKHLPQHQTKYAIHIRHGFGSRNINAIIIFACELPVKKCRKSRRRHEIMIVLFAGTFLSHKYSRFCLFLRGKQLAHKYIERRRRNTKPALYPQHGKHGPKSIQPYLGSLFCLEAFKAFVADAPLVVPQGERRESLCGGCNGKVSKGALLTINNR